MPASAVVKNCYRYSTYKKTSYSQWYFSIVDVCQFLTDSTNGRMYWNKLKQRLKSEGNETVTNCHQLKIKTPLRTGHQSTTGANATALNEQSP